MNADTIKKEARTETFDDLKKTIRDLEKREKQHEAERVRYEQAIDETSRKQDEINGLLKCARAVLRSSSFEKTAREIFDVCCELTGARSGYVALLDDTGRENEVLFLESGGLECTVDPDLPMPIRGLRSEAYKTGTAVFHNDFMKSDWVKFMPEGHVSLDNVLFAPLTIDGRAVGLLGIANKEGGFTDEDAVLATAFGEIASIALHNSRTLDSLRTALANIKTLQGLLPICSSCKKIRDDQGYWKQIETYIHQHSDVEFSHGLCPECLTQLYPDLAEEYEEEQKRIAGTGFGSGSSGQ